jgi:N6-L-threonylcarbamoyladenine synthase
MRREVYPALYRCAAADVVRLTSESVASPRATAEAWAALDETVLLAGNGLRKYADLFIEVMGARATFAPEPHWSPSGESLLLAAWRARRDGVLGDGNAATLLPVYTRLSDAEEAERVRCGTGTTAAPSSGVAGPPTHEDAR